MIKKILSCFLMIMCCSIANANIHIDGKVATTIIKEHIDEKHKLSASMEYNAQLDVTGNNTMSAAGLYKVCIAAGWDIEQPAGKDKCDKFVQALVEKADYKYYAACDKKYKDNKNYKCIDNVFNDIEVQFAQAKNLAQEYVRVKYGDDIVCSTDIRTETINDYIKCTSKLNPTYYEFKFDDLKESNANDGKFVQREFGRGLCLIYDGNPENVTSKPLAVVLEKYVEDLLETFECKIDDCINFNTNINKWGYASQITQGTDCIVSYIGGTENLQTNENYYAKFDGKNFVIYKDNNIIKMWPAVSGRGKTATDSRPTICQKPKYQACANIGPTPSGLYYIYQNEIQYADNITLGNFNSNSPRADTLREAWGDARVLLHPDSNTNLFNRKPDMYIHGGKYKGSAGCIDLTINIMDFIRWFESQTEFSTLKVFVDYGKLEEICTDCNEQQCMPCKCITDVKDCVYI